MRKMFKIKMSFKCVVIAFCFLVVLLMFALFPSKIPKAWHQNDIYHIFKSLIYWQRFDLSSPPIKPYNISIPLTGALLKEFELSHVGKYNNFVLYKMDNEKGDLKNSNAFQELESFLYFQPLMSISERNILLYTFHVFLEVCKKFNFTYFVIEGSLLGAYRHMGFIPWDDDIDVIMDVKEWVKIRDAFSGIPDVELLTDSKFQWKIFPRALDYSDGKRFKYPFVDIFFYDTDSTHIWGLTPATKPNILFDKRDIFPLTTLPFENLVVYVPKKTEKVLKSIFDANVCVSANYLHKRNHEAPAHLVKSIQCKYLYNLHPFVFHHINKSSESSFDVLKISDTVLKVIKVTNV